MQNFKVIQPVEIRSINSSQLEIRGLLPTNSPSEIINDKKSNRGFIEVIKPLAFTMAIEKGKPLILINHDYSKEMEVVSFKSKETKKGLEFIAVVKKNNISRELLMDTDKINGLSFGFKVGIENWKGQYRYIYPFERLIEISVLKGKQPCYPATEVAINSKNEELITTEDIKQWVNRMKLDILRQELGNFKKVSL